MKKNDNIRVYAWAEFIIWLIIIAITIFAFRYHSYQNQKQYKNYQIFMEDVDGLIVGSPVKFLGVQIGYVKKIQVISSEVYIKFSITQKGLTLPLGCIATVEGSGLGGSKALEIYPPQKGTCTDKIIVSKPPTRLGKVMTLFDDIFREMDSIFSTLDYTSRQFDFENGIPKNIVEPADATEKIIRIENTVNFINNTKKRMQNKMKAKRVQNGSEFDESEQSEGDK